MQEDETNDKSGQGQDNPASQPTKHPGGKHPTSWYQVPAQDVINLTAPVAARILQMHIERRRGFRDLKASLQRACEYVIDHAIGKAKIKVEHSGGILTYSALAESAEKLEQKPPKALAEALDIAHKHQQKLAGDDAKEVQS